jgi:hypothetical protein
MSGMIPQMKAFFKINPKYASLVALVICSSNLASCIDLDRMHSDVDEEKKRKLEQGRLKSSNFRQREKDRKALADPTTGT